MQRATPGDGRRRSIEIRDALLRLRNSKRGMKKINQVLRVDPLAWRVTRRYYCLDGENRISQEKLSEVYRISRYQLMYKIRTVCCFLGVPGAYTKDAQCGVRMLKKRIRRSEENRKWFADLGLREVRLPKGLRANFHDVYRYVLRVWRLNRLEFDTLETKERDILIERFGLKDGVSKTREVLGEKYNCSAEWIRRLEEQALIKVKRVYHSELMEASH